MGAEGGAAPSEGRRQLARRASTVTIAVFASRILGLVREQVFAVAFGAGRELDAFITAFRIPNLLRDLFAEGALSVAFVSTFTRTFARDGEAAAWRLANLVLNALAIVVGALCLLGIWWSPAIVDAIAPGFAAVPGKRDLTVSLTRLMFPFLPLVALAAVVMGILNTRDRFGVPASASAFFNLGSIVGGLGCAWWLAPSFVHDVWSAVRHGTASPLDPVLAARAITGMALGTLIGGSLQLLIQLPSLGTVGFRYRPIVSWGDPGVRQVLALMGPATIGAAAVQVNVFVNNNFASYLGDGPVSWLNVAFRFMQLPIGLFGVAIGTVTLPRVSRHVARGEHAAIARSVNQALEMIALLCVPAAAGLAVLGVPLIGLIYEHGRFGAADTTAAAQALGAYAVGLAGYAGIKVLAPAFFALGDASTPMRVSLISILLNAVMNWTFLRVLNLGHVGLALSTSLVALANFISLFVPLSRRVEGIGHGLVRPLAGILGATGAMATILMAGDYLLAARLGASGVVSHLVRVSALVPLGAVVFWVTARVLGVSLPGPRRRGH